jgi:predicted  nucleic acid-binding Zn-ribbon protein
MKNFFKAISLLLAGSACTLTANAQEGATKDGFMKSAFRDMKESAKLQRQIDKANFQAVKLETKAFYEEQKRLSKPSARSAAEKARMQRELEAANKRVEEAQAKVNSTKKL